MQGRYDDAARLLEQGADINGSTSLKWGATTMMFAAAAGPEYLDWALAHGGDPNLRDHMGANALHYAVRANKIDNVRMLLALGVEQEARDWNQKRPVDLAKVGDRKEILALFENPQASAPTERPVR